MQICIMKTFAINLVLCCLLSAIPFLGFSQYDDEIPDSGILNTDKKPNRRMRDKKPLNLDNFFIGSGVGLNFGGNYFRFDVLPYFGYRLGDAIAPAVGIDYTFYYDFSTQSELNIWGPKVILKLRPFKSSRQLQGFYLYGEYAHLIVDAKSGTSTLRAFQPRENVGVGWTTNFGKGSGMTSEFLFDLYNIVHRPNVSIFNNPFSYRIGFYYGF
jgi:hypothetical protein